MSLKTSFCNKSIIKSDIRRFWWISALHTMLLLLTGVLVFFNNLRYTNYSEATTYSHSPIFESLVVFFFFAIAVPIVVGTFVFSYLHSGKMSAFAHSIPVLRRTHYVSHVISGLILSIAPIIINAIILILMRTSSDIRETFEISHLMYIVLGSIIYTLIAFSGTVFVSSFVANSVAALIFTVVFGALPIVAETFWTFFISTQLYGFPNSLDNLFFDFLYIAPSNILNGANPIIYITLSIIFLLSGYALYQKRNLEINAEIVAFPSLRPVFIYGAAIAGGCFGFSYFNALSDVTCALALIPFGILGIIIATMIVKKSFRVLKSVLKPLIAFTLVVVAIFTVTEFDLIGYETKVPDAENVESVNFDLLSKRSYKMPYDTSGTPIKPVHDFEPVFTDTADIKNVTKLHKYIIDNRPHYTFDNLNLTYKLKNGKTIHRFYPIGFDQHLDAAEIVIESDTIRKSYFPILIDDERKIISLTIDGISTDKLKENNGMYSYQNSTTISDREKIAEITDALKKELKTADYSEYALYSSDNVVCHVNISFRKPYVYEDGTPVSEWKTPIEYETYYIRDTYTNTLNVLGD